MLLKKLLLVQGEVDLQATRRARTEGFKKSAQLNAEGLKMALSEPSLAGTILLYLSTIEEADGARSLLRLLFVVSNHNNGATILLIKFVKYLHHLCTHL